MFTRPGDCNLPTKRKLDAEHSRTLILHTAEMIILEDGYAGVSIRRVAAKALLKPSLVHYYFRTTDELFLAVFRQVSDRNKVRMSQVLSSDKPIRGLWNLA